MPKTSSLTVIVGIFILGAILLFIGFSLQLSEKSLNKNSYQLNAWFEDASGLEKGDDVRVGGIATGQVMSVDFDTSRAMARVAFSVQDDIKLPDDSVVMVEQSALLGNTQLSISFGKSPSSLAPGSEVLAENKPDIDALIASVTRTSDDARALMTSLDENQKKTFTAIEEIIEENRADIRESTKAMADAGPKLDSLASNLEEITENLRNGKGTLGKLYQDESLYNDLKDSIGEAKQIASDIRDSDGTLAKLIYDDSIAVKAEETFTKIGNASDDIQSLLADNRDKIDNLITSMESVGPKIEEAANKFEAFGDKLNSEDGTLGRLLNDPTLYKEAERTFRTVGENFEAAEEQGVIRSFFGVIFGSLV